MATTEDDETYQHQDDEEDEEGRNGVEANDETDANNNSSSSASASHSLSHHRGSGGGASSSFRAYYNPSSPSPPPLPLGSMKKMTHRHYRHHHHHQSSSLNSVQNKSQSANNLLSFGSGRNDEANDDETKEEVNDNQVGESTMSVGDDMKSTTAAVFAAAVSEPSVAAANSGANTSRVEVRSSPVVGEANIPPVFPAAVTTGAPTSSSSSAAYFPLEPTMEECLESLDISYDANNSLNDLVAAAALVNLNANSQQHNVLSKNDGNYHFSI